MDIDVNAGACIASAIVLGTIGVLSFIVQPGLVQGFVVELGVSEAGANDLAFVEMAGVALATYLSAVLSRHIDWRKIVGAGLGLAIIGNLLSAFLAIGPFFQAARFLTGLGEGAIISISFAIIGLTARPERNLALYLVLLLTYGALGLWAMPFGFSTIGLSGIFLVWAGLTGAALITLRYLPHSAENQHTISPDAADIGWPMLIVALFAVLLYNTAIGTAWANLFLIGMDIRPDEQAIANALLLAQFVAIFGALIPVFMEAQLGRWLPIISGILLGAGFLALLLGQPTYGLFIISVSGFNFFWNFFLPFMLSAVADMRRKEIISVAIAMQMTGLGFGPFVAARLLGDDVGFHTIILTTVIMMGVSLMLLSIAERARRKAAACNTHLSQGSFESETL